jgi:preprotein translocase subunit SecG
MLYGLFVAILVFVCLLLIVVVLLQGGRGGLGDALGGSGSQSLFGGGTNLAIAKFTTWAVAAFFATCVILAMLSTARGRSVLEQVPAVLPEAVVPGLELPAEPQADTDEAPATVEETEQAAVETAPPEAIPAPEASQPSSEPVPPGVDQH